MDTGSYEQFAEGYFLTAKAMAWFWDAYLDPARRAAQPQLGDHQEADQARAFQAAWEAGWQAGRSAGWQEGWDLRSAVDVVVWYVDSWDDL